MPQKNPFNSTRITELIIYIADLSPEQRGTTEIGDSMLANYVAVYYYNNELQFVRWFFKPDREHALYLNSDSWFELQLIKHLPWTDIVNYFIDAKERKND